MGQRLPYRRTRRRVEGHRADALRPDGLDGRRTHRSRVATTDEVLRSLGDPETAERTRTQMVRLAQARYSINGNEAEDVVQNAFMAYLEVRHRYDAKSNSHAILFGILFMKCLEHIDRSVREKRRLERYCSTPDAARESVWLRPGSPGEEPSAIAQLIRNEDGKLIRRVVNRLRPKSRELAELITRNGLTRQDLIKRLRINQNTLDSRLHACRRELRSLLAEQEIAM